MEDSKRNKITGLVGTLLFHGILIAFLFYWTLGRVSVPEEEGLSGVLVQMGNIDEASGTFEPEQLNEQPLADNTPPPPPEDVKMITQDMEESVNIAAKKEIEKERKKEKERLLEKERQKRIQEEQRRKEANASALAMAAFGKAAGGNKGNSSSGSGVQGSPDGNSSTGKLTGVGGYGEYDLGGRSIGADGLPKPAYVANVSGTVKVDIVVTPGGSVLGTPTINKAGTDIIDASQRNAAVVAAKKAKFVVIPGTNNQRGSITYRFNLR